MIKKLYFTGTDYDELKCAINLICTIKRLYINKNEPIYFGYKVVKKMTILIFVCNILFKIMSLVMVIV